MQISTSKIFRNHISLHIVAGSLLLLSLFPSHALADRKCKDRTWLSDDDDLDGSVFFGDDDLCHKHKLSAGQIVGIVFGGVGALLILIGLLTCLCCRGRKRRTAAPAPRAGFFSKFGRKRKQEVSRSAALHNPAPNAEQTDAQRVMASAQV
ncbi:hypothetical protein DFH28DRAFT_968041 [Melampsora americana]|nr:hypothetical protein DFH28DRAFT_968041 [Melampsora americana]